MTIFFTFLTPTLVMQCKTGHTTFNFKIILTKVIIQYIVGAPAFMVCRFLIGIGQGVINPAYSVLIAAWTPLSERSTMVTIVFAGSQVS